MIFSVPSLAALLAFSSTVAAGRICLARSCTLGTPTGGGPACSMQMWSAGLEPCGSESSEVRGGGETNDIDSPQDITLCDKDIRIIADDSAPGGAVLEIDGSTYEGIDLQENEDTDERCNEGCTLNPNFGRIFWDSAPVCD